MNEHRMSEPRKSYTAPELTEFGSVSELTQRLGSGFEEERD